MQNHYERRDITIDGLGEFADNHPIFSATHGASSFQPEPADIQDPPHSSYVSSPPDKHFEFLSKSKHWSRPTCPDNKSEQPSASRPSAPCFPRAQTAAHAAPQEPPEPAGLCYIAAEQQTVGQRSGARTFGSFGSPSHVYT